MNRALVSLRRVLLWMLVFFLLALPITLWRNSAESAEPSEIMGRVLDLAFYISGVFSIGGSVLVLYLVTAIRLSWSSIQRRRARKYLTIEGEDHKNPVTRKHFIGTLLYIIFIAFPGAIQEREPGTPMVAGGIHMFLLISAYTLAGFHVLVASFVVHIRLIALLVKAVRRKRIRKQEDEEALIESRTDAGEIGAAVTKKLAGVNTGVDEEEANLETPVPHTATAPALVDVVSDDDKDEALQGDVEKVDCMATEQVLE